MLKGWIPIAVAAALGLAAFASGYAGIKMREEEVTRGWNLVEVLTYTKSMRPGEVVTSDSIDVDVMPQRFFHQSVIMTPRFRGEALSKELLVHVEKGMPVEWHQLAGLREQDLLSTQVREGFRAVSINVSEASLDVVFGSAVILSPDHRTIAYAASDGLWCGGSTASSQGESWTVASTTRCSRPTASGSPTSR